MTESERMTLFQGMDMGSFGGYPMPAGQPYTESNMSLQNPNGPLIQRKVAKNNAGGYEANRDLQD